MLIENVSLDIDGNAWHISNEVCLGDPRNVSGFGETLSDAIADFKHEFRPGVTGGLSLDARPIQYDGFVGIDIDDEVNIKRIGYKHRERHLLIVFCNDKEYCYQDVPVGVWQALLVSERKGTYLAQHIKGNFRYYARQDD
jgi:hypothetical protein